MNAAVAPTFELKLSGAAEPETLAAWLADADANPEAVYASGADLPRAAAGVVLVGRWAAAKLVTTHQRRDPADARRWQYLVRKGGVQDPSGAAAPVSPFPPGRTGRAHPYRSARNNAARLLELLRDAAAAGGACPSYAQAAKGIGLAPGERGKQAARSIFRRLEREGKIEVAGGCTARVVTILAKGRACGLRTGEPA